MKPEATHADRAVEAIDSLRWWYDREPPEYERANLSALQGLGHALLAIHDELRAVTKALYDGRV